MWTVSPVADLYQGHVLDYDEDEDMLRCTRCGDLVGPDGFDPILGRSPSDMRPCPMADAFRYYESPAIYTPAAGDPPSVFLGGGIPNVAPWHDRVVELLKASGRPMVVLNPRRQNFPVGDPEAGRAQVAWEHEHLHKADISLFWFGESDASVTVQPTTLFELGVALGEGYRRVLVVGADRAYPRRDILEYQLAHYSPVPLDSLESLVSGVLEKVDDLSTDRDEVSRG